MRKAILAVTAVVAAASLAACGSDAGGGGTGSDKVTLTLWHNYGTEQNAVATQKLTDAYHKAHPNVSFKLVSQPGDNYFSLLQAAAISKTGPTWQSCGLVCSP